SSARSCRASTCEPDGSLARAPRRAARRQGGHSSVTSQAAPLTTGPVKVVGTGLLGTSIALALRALDVPVQLSDTSPSALALARDMGAGEPVDGASPEPALVVVATPPDIA